jgi:hypothetical protein
LKKEKKPSKIELFKKLAKINNEGCCDWIDKSQFVGEYSELNFNNSADWARQDGSFGIKYLVEFDRSITPGEKIDRIRTIGFNPDNKFSNSIRSDIRKKILTERCVWTGLPDVEVDHKNGQKNNPRIWDIKLQTLDDFQALHKSMNCKKRQLCKNCKLTGIRYDAKNLGYDKSYTSGNENLDKNNPNGCVGCFLYDIKDFKSKSCQVN